MINLLRGSRSVTLIDITNVRSRTQYLIPSNIILRRMSDTHRPINIYSVYRSVVTLELEEKI